MSVINRMLLELDERHDSAQQNLPGMVRAVPARLPGTPYRVWLGDVLAIALTLLLGFFIWRMAVSQKTAIAPVASAPAATAAPLPALASTPLQLQSANALERVPVAADEVQAIILAPTPIPAPVATPTLRKNFLPKQDVASEIGVSADSTILGMKRVSKEQQADFRYREALSLMAQSRVSDAQTALEDALRLDPKNLAARQALLSIFLTAKRYPQAEQILQEGLRLNLAVAPLATALASVQLERGDPAAALVTLEKYAPQAHGAAEYHGVYAALLQRTGRHAEAIEQFQAALKIQTNHAPWLMGLGISLQAEKRYAEAEPAYSRARAGNGLSPELQAFVEQRLQQIRQTR